MSASEAHGWYVVLRHMPADPFQRPRFEELGPFERRDTAIRRGRDAEAGDPALTARIVPARHRPSLARNAWQAGDAPPHEEESP